MKKIAVICTSIFHVIHTKKLVKELQNQGIEITYVNFAPQHIGDTYSKLETYLKDELYQTSLEFYSSQQVYDAVLVHHFIPGLQLLNGSIKKIRIMYGYAKDAWNYAEWNKIFDLILSYGPYAQLKLSRFLNVKTIGHPRLKESYKVMTEDVYGKEIDYEVNKPTLLYCPTWSELSSEKEMIQALKLFSEEYKVFIKLHHNSKNTVKFGELEDVYVFDEYIDLFDLLFNCDLILSDYSGAIFDAMLFKKPIVLFDSTELNFKDTGLYNTTIMSNIMEDNEGVQEQSISLDVRVRDYIPHASNVEDVMSLLKEYSTKSFFEYEELLPELYNFRDLQANKRAVNEIIEILKKDQTIELNSYKQIDLQLVMQFFENNIDEKIAIWGAGELGQVFNAWLLSKDYKIDAFFDSSDEKENLIVQGISISKPKYDYKIIIAVTSHHKEITEMLQDYGLKYGKDFIYPF